MKRLATIAAAAALTSALITGCGNDEVQVYRVEKTSGASASAMKMPSGHPPLEKGNAGMAGMPEGHPPMGQAGGSAPVPKVGLRWKLPKGWTEKPGSGMRMATLIPGEGESDLQFSVIALGGAAGGDLANVNRWRRQVGLDPIDKQTFARDIETISAPAGKVYLADIAGPEARILAGFVKAGETTWFFKAWGKKEAVNKVKPSFRSLLKSLRPPK